MSVDVRLPDTTRKTFVTDRLTQQRQVRPNTLQSDRKASRPLLVLTVKQCDPAPEKFDTTIPTRRCSVPLDHLEREQQKVVRPPKAWLAAIRAMFHDAALRHPGPAATIERAFFIRPDRLQRRLPRSPEAEVIAPPAGPNRATWLWQRCGVVRSCRPDAPRAARLIGLSRAFIHLGTMRRLVASARGVRGS